MNSDRTKAVTGCRVSGGGHGRDGRLDALRGLCLVDVVLVHLAYDGLGFPEPFDTFIKHYTRFAAGGFVFLAGLTVAIVFGPGVGASSPERWRTFRRLWRRAGELVVVDVFASCAYRLLDLVRGFPSDPHSPLGQALGEIVLLQRPGLTGGILLLYAVLLLCAPALLDAKRRFGAAPIALASAALYASAVLAGGPRWPPYDFPVLYWQPVFVAGLLSERFYRRLAEARLAARGAQALLSLAPFTMVFASLHGPEFGVHAVTRAWQLDFAKTPLQPGALLWYLTIVHVVVAWWLLAWSPRLARTRAAGILMSLGRHSLVVYAAHVFTGAVVLELVWSAWPPPGVRAVLAGADLAALAGLCSLLDSVRKRRAVNCPSTSPAGKSASPAGRTARTEPASWSESTGTA